MSHRFIWKNAEEFNGIVQFERLCKISKRFLIATSDDSQAYGKTHVLSNNRYRSKENLQALGPLEPHYEQDNRGIVASPHAVVLRVNVTEIDAWVDLHDFRGTISRQLQ